MAQLHVELVSVEREVWAGEADMVIARTTEGEIGILPGHAPVLAALDEGGVVRVVQGGGQEVRAAVHGGFLSVTDRGVSVLAELAELGQDVDVARAQSALDRASSSDGDEAAAASRRARSRLAAAGRPA